MSKWTRPTTVPFPSTWATFEGQKIINGTRRTYWIQDVTEEHKEEIIKYMLEGFMADEPTCKYSKALQTPGAEAEFRKAWQKCLDNNLGLVCLTKDENNKPTIAAVNCTTICTIDDKINLDEISFSAWVAFFYTKTEADPFNKLNIREYLDGMGLYVLPKYRGEGLGAQLLKAREPLARACGLTASVTVYSSVFSQRAAERAGYKNLLEIDYDELEKVNPRCSFPGIKEHSPSMKVMYILYK